MTHVFGNIFGNKVRKKFSYCLGKGSLFVVGTASWQLSEHQAKVSERKF